MSGDRGTLTDVFPPCRHQQPEVSKAYSYRYCQVADSTHGATASSLWIASLDIGASASAAPGLRGGVCYPGAESCASGSTPRARRSLWANAMPREYWSTST